MSLSYLSIFPLSPSLPTRPAARKGVDRYAHPPVSATWGVVCLSLLRFEGQQKPIELLTIRSGIFCAVDCLGVQSERLMTSWTPSTGTYSDNRRRQPSVEREWETKGEKGRGTRGRRKVAQSGSTITEVPLQRERRRLPPWPTTVNAGRETAV